MISHDMQRSQRLNGLRSWRWGGRGQIIWGMIIRLATLSSNTTCLDFSSSFVIGNDHSGWRNQTLR